jgi:hypothetical protein
MSITQRRLSLAAGLTAGLLVLSACAAGPGSSPPTSTASPSGETTEVAPPDGRVIGVGTVIDSAGDVRLCLGAIMESYPPQCHGIPIDGWTWDGLDGNESSGETTWGAYAVYGTYDGERFAVTDPPIMLALFDPVAPEDPTGGVDGKTPNEELTRIQDEIARTSGERLLTVGVWDGYVRVMVPWDDGSLQTSMDAAYGEGVVIVDSALREVD